MEERTRIFVDMDGTLAEFRTVDTLEKLYEKNYFLSLNPHYNVVDAVKLLNADPQYEVFILSAVLTDSKYALDEKNAWLDKYLPEIDKEHRVFPPCGESKKDYIPGGIRESDCLLDDYTKNLLEWEPPAHGVKFINGINHTHKTWKGSIVYGVPWQEVTTIKTNMGVMPVSKYRDMAARQVGFKDYKDMYSKGYRLGNEYDLPEHNEPSAEQLYNAIAGQITKRRLGLDKPSNDRSNTGIKR